MQLSHVRRYIDEIVKTAEAAEVPDSLLGEALTLRIVALQAVDVHLLFTP